MRSEQKTERNIHDNGDEKYKQQQVLLIVMGRKINYANEITTT
jgi:hypothetical protein